MANEIYQVRGTAIVWTDTGGDEQLDLKNLASDGTLGGSYYDRNTGPGTGATQPDEYEWEMIIDGFEASPSIAIGETVDLYFSQGNSTTEFDGQVVTAPSDTVDTATGPDTNMLPNMLYAGSAKCFSTTNGDELQVRGIVRFSARYVFPVVHNQAAASLLNSGGVHKVTLVPIYYQGQ